MGGVNPVNVSVAGSLGSSAGGGIGRAGIQASDKPERRNASAKRLMSLSRVKEVCPLQSEKPSRSATRAGQLRTPQRTRTTDSCIVGGSGWPLDVTVSSASWPFATEKRKNETP